MSSLCKSLLVVVLLASSAATAQAATGMAYSFGGRESPQVNNMLSARYDYLVQTNLRFRHYRMYKECHPITWPGLREECLSTFDTMQPFLR